MTAPDGAIHLPLIIGMTDASGGPLPRLRGESIRRSAPPVGIQPPLPAADRPLTESVNDTDPLALLERGTLDSNEVDTAG